MPRKTSITKELFIQEKNNGLSEEEIAEKYGVLRKTLHQYELNWGLREYSEAHKKRMKAFNIDKEEVRKMLNEGHSRHSIAVHFNVTFSTINKMIIAYDLDASGKRRHFGDSLKIEEDFLKGNVKFAEPPKKPFKDVVKGQKVIDVSCLYGL